MKTLKHLAAGAALLGAVTTAQAESITFGVEIPPIATLIVRDGILKDAVSMVKAAVDNTAAANSEVVGGFTVITNMPKWNIYFGFANGGALKNQTGRQITNDAGTALYLGTESTAAAATAGQAAVFLQSADDIKALDQAGTPVDVGPISAIGATTTPSVNNSANNTLTASLKATGTTICNAGAALCVFTTPWLTATDMTTANFDIRTGLESATPLASVAGSYTETMYLTLVTTY